MLICFSVIISSWTSCHIRTYRSTSTFEYHILFHSAVQFMTCLKRPLSMNIYTILIKNGTAMNMLLLLPTWQCASMVYIPKGSISSPKKLCIKFSYIFLNVPQKFFINLYIYICSNLYLSHQLCENKPLLYILINVDDY